MASCIDLTILGYIFPFFSASNDQQWEQQHGLKFDVSLGDYQTHEELLAKSTTSHERHNNSSHLLYELRGIPELGPTKRSSQSPDMVLEIEIMLHEISLRERRDKYLQGVPSRP
jgi:hypothetical protein